MSEIWALMDKMYQMYILCKFQIVEIARDGEFAVASLPTISILNLVAASRHVGLVEGNIYFSRRRLV
jgi:hypothetical protein